MDEPILKVYGKEYPLATEFDLGEMCDAERYFGVDFNDTSKSRLALTASTIWISIRRVDPTVTLEDIRSIDADTLQEIGEHLDGKADPTKRSATSGSDAPTSESSTNGSDGSGIDQLLSGVHGSASTTTSDPATSLT